MSTPFNPDNNPLNPDDTATDSTDFNSIDGTAETENLDKLNNLNSATGVNETAETKSLPKSENIDQVNATSAWGAPSSTSAPTTGTGTGTYGASPYGTTQYPQHGVPTAGYPPQYGYPQGAYPGQPMVGGQPAQKKSFFSALFDFSFRDFVTDDFAKVLYIIHIVTQILFWIGGLFFTITSTSLVYGAGIFSVFAWLIFGTIWTVLNIIIGRVILEFVISVIRLYQNSEKLVEQGEKE